MTISHLQQTHEATEATAPIASVAADGSAGFDNGARSRFNAWFFRAFDRYLNHITA
ncbi:MAG: hypothetical protein R2755_18615 [Acidimicrobiales bacterium]